MKIISNLLNFLQEQIGKKMANVSHNSNIGDENINSMEQSTQLTTSRSQKLRKSDCCGQKEVCMQNHEASFPQQKLQNNVEVQVRESGMLNENAGNCKGIIDLECSPQKGSG